MNLLHKTLLAISLIGGINSAFAAPKVCADLPDHAALKAALIEARQQDNAGFNLDMWGATV